MDLAVEPTPGLDSASELALMPVLAVVVLEAWAQAPGSVLALDSVPTLG